MPVQRLDAALVVTSRHPASLTARYRALLENHLRLFARFGDRGCEVDRIIVDTAHRQHLTRVVLVQSPDLLGTPTGSGGPAPSSHHIQDAFGSAHRSTPQSTSTH